MKIPKIKIFAHLDLGYLLITTKWVPLNNQRRGPSVAKMFYLKDIYKIPFWVIKQWLDKENWKYWGL